MNDESEGHLTRRSLLKTGAGGAIGGLLPVIQYGPRENPHYRAIVRVEWRDGAPNLRAAGRRRCDGAPAGIMRSAKFSEVKPDDRFGSVDSIPLVRRGVATRQTGTKT